MEEQKTSEWVKLYDQRQNCIRVKQHLAIDKLSKSKRKNKEELIKSMKLVEFDGLLFEQLFDTIRQRSEDKNAQHHVTLEELSTIMKWKLFRGQFRPRLQTLIDSNKDAEVVQCSKKGFELIQTAIDTNSGNVCDITALKSSLTALCKLKGVGVATASLILAVYTKIVPFMADESMLAMWPNAALKYNMKTYLKYAQQLINKCAELSEVENSEDAKEESEGKVELTPFVLGECLWTQHILKKHSGYLKDNTTPSKVVHKSSAMKRKININNDLVCEAEGPPNKKRKV